MDESELYPSEDYKLWNHSKPLLQFPADSGFENIDAPKREDNDLNEYIRNLPSVTKILKLTMSEENKLRLNVWKEKMILKMGLEAFEKNARIDFETRSSASFGNRYVYQMT